MKFVVLSTLVAVAFAEFLQPPDDPAPAFAAASHAAAAAAALKAPSLNEAAINTANAKRQRNLNHQAQHHGAGVGTAPYYGVPGTSIKGFHNGNYYGAYNGVYNGAYGYGRHGAYNRAYGHGYNRAYDRRFAGYQGPHTGAYIYGGA